MIRIVSSMLCTAILLSGCASSADDTEEIALDARLDRVSERLARAGREGASGVLRISLGGRVLLESGYGSASCTNEEDVTPDHVFMIGSITKEFTRVLGFVLEEQGVIAFDDTVSELLPGFRGPIARVSVQHLMDHTGGLPNLIDRRGRPVPYTVEYDYERVTRNELIERAQLARLESEPGKREQYSNLGYQLLAAIYETASGETYPDLLRRHIFDPAEMTGTDFWFPDQEKRHFADGCGANNERWGNPMDDAMWGESGPSWNLIGAGGLLSKAESLNRFFEGIGSGAYFADSAQSEKYKSSRMVYSERRQQRVMGPAGSNGIFNAVAFWADDDRFSVILMTNRSNHPAEGGIFRDIMGLLPLSTPAASGVE